MGILIIEPRNQWCSHSYYTELARILWLESEPLSVKHGVDQSTADRFLRTATAS